MRSTIILLLALGQIYAQSISATAVSKSYPNPSSMKFPYDSDHSTNQPLATGTVYSPPAGGGADFVYWGWICIVDSSNALMYGGNLKYSDDGCVHTQVMQNKGWVRIDSLLKARNPLQNRLLEVRELQKSVKNILAKTRHLFFEGLTSGEENKVITDSINPQIKYLANALKTSANGLESMTGLSSYHAQQALYSSQRIKAAADSLSLLGSQIQSVDLMRMSRVQISLEIAGDAMEAEPPPRALSMITWDPVTKQFAVFGGDHLDYLTNDLWVFDPSIPQWKQKYSASAPIPRGDHWLVANDSGQLILKGGFTYKTNGGLSRQSYMHIGPAEWRYDMQTNQWLSAGTGGGSAVATDSRVYRSTLHLPERFMAGEKPSSAANAAFLEKIGVNTWVDMMVPIKSVSNRDWGTVAYDPDRDMIYIYCGGHSAYPGTDALHYHLATNRYEQTVPAEAPLGWCGSSGHSAKGWSFNKRPYMSNHTWNSYEYHPVLKKMILVGREWVCCTTPVELYSDRYQYVYNPDNGDWESRHFVASMYNEKQGNTQLCNTTLGMLNWNGKREIWKLNDKTLEWNKLAVTGTIPQPVVDGSGVVFDPKRNRMLMTTLNTYQAPFNGVIYSMDLSTSAITAITPNNSTAVSRVKYLREVVYLPKMDIFLFEDTNSVGPGKYLVYDPSDNLWKGAEISGTCDFGNHAGMILDNKRDLIWHLNVNNGNARVLKIDTATLKLTTLAPTSTREQVLISAQPAVTIQTNSITNGFRVIVGGITNYAKMNLGIYDVKGRLVADLSERIDTEINSGKNEFVWYKNGQPAGVYFLCLNINNKRIYSRFVNMH
ncbi:MAG: T9SS type A sorting domain-containing protein [Fibrobacteres bacterium]|nr:T9SS type A sorting domain-containing protein [Fibrobacterota bacterium]